MTAEPAPRWPEPVRGKIAAIPTDLYDAWVATRHRARVWAATVREYETEIRNLIGDATVITADGKPVLYRRVTPHNNVSWIQDVLVRAERETDNVSWIQDVLVRAE